jgi:hypothetical protein
MVLMSERPMGEGEIMSKIWKYLWGLLRGYNVGMKDIVYWEWERILHWSADLSKETIKKEPMNIYLIAKTVE